MDVIRGVRTSCQHGLVDGELDVMNFGSWEYSKFLDDVDSFKNTKTHKATKSLPGKANSSALRVCSFYE